MSGDGMPTIVYRGLSCKSHAELWNRRQDLRFAMLKYLRWFLDPVAANRPSWAAAIEQAPGSLRECYDRVDKELIFAGELDHLSDHWFPSNTTTSFFRVLSWFIDNNNNYTLDPGEIGGFGYPDIGFGKRFEQINANGFIEAFEASLFLPSKSDTTIDGTKLELEQAPSSSARSFKGRTEPVRSRKIDMYWVCGKDYSADMQIFFDPERVTVFTVTPPYNGPADGPPEIADVSSKKDVAGSGMILVRDFGAPFDATNIKTVFVEPVHGG